MAIPSKLSREKSKLRLEAKQLGCKITSTVYGKNKFKNISKIDVFYQIRNVSFLKDAHFIRDKNEFILYSPLKLKHSDKFNDVYNWLREISPTIKEIIFTPNLIMFLWEEKKGIDELKQVLKFLKS